MQCPKCKQQLDEGVRFCPNHGTPLIQTGATLANATPTDHPATEAAGDRPPTKELELPVIVGNRYQLLSLRGGGGMAKVYRATDMTLEREVAVKLISPDLRNDTEFDTRFRREAKIASQLTDPYIVVVHDYGLDPTLGPYLVMEYLVGQSLRERLATSGPLPLKAGLQLAGQLLLALKHAHRKGVIHRDIKPDNIFLLNQSGLRLFLRVLDFGIARIYRRDDAARVETLTSAGIDRGTEGQEPLTEPGTAPGTPRYMSPEQLAGRPVDPRSDLYSAALVIHEALTGRLPFVDGKTPMELCPEAPLELQALLEQCLKPNPDDRPGSAIDVFLRLQEIGKGCGILLLPPGSLGGTTATREVSTGSSPNEATVAYVSARFRRVKWRSRMIALVGAIVAGALATWAFWSAWR